MNPAAHRRAAWALLALAFLLRLVPALAIPFPPPVYGDAVQYDALARNLLDGRGYTLDAEPPFRPYVMRAPGYPVFAAAALAAGGKHPKAVWFAQALLDAATCFLVYLLARRAFSPAAGLLALALAAALLPSTLYVPYHVPEALSAFLLAFSAWLWMRLHEAEEAGWKAPLALGAALASLGYARPEFFPLTFVTAGWFALHRRPVKFFAALALGWLLVVAPWTARNAWQTGKPLMLVDGGGGVNLWVGTWGQNGEMWIIRRASDGGVVARVVPPHACDDEKECARAHGALNAYILRLHEDPSCTWEGRDPDRVFWEMGMERLRRDPWKYLYLRIAESRLLWLPRFAVGMPRLTRLALGAAFLLCALGAGALGLRRKGVQILWLLAAYYAAVHFPFHAEPRYSVAFYPLVMTLAAGFPFLLAARRSPPKAAP